MVILWYENIVEVGLLVMQLALSRRVCHADMIEEVMCCSRIKRISTYWNG